MARLMGNIKFSGTVDNLCFYRMEGQIYVRRKSSLTRKKVKTSPRFLLTRVYAGLMSDASRIGSVIYRALPKEFRQFWMYRSFTGEALRLLKAGKTKEEATKGLWQTYVTVWEIKQHDNSSEAKSITSTSGRKRSDRSLTIVSRNTSAANNDPKVFPLPLKRDTGTKRCRVAGSKRYLSG